MNGKRFGVVILLSLSVGANGRFSAQEPAATVTFQPKVGQSVFVVVVKGECGRSGLSAINGREYTLPTQQQTDDERQTLDPGRPRRAPRNFTEPDAKVKKEAEGELKKKFRLVDSPDKADFVLHVCSRYLFDVFPVPPPNASNSRVGVRAMALTPQAFQQAVGVYQRLWSTSWWRFDSAESVPSGVSVRNIPRSSGIEGGRAIVIRGGTGGPRDVSAKDAVKKFVKYVTKSKASAELAARARKDAKPAVAPGGTTATPTTAGATTTSPAEKPAETNQPALEAGETVSIETALVSIPVIITDQSGKYVPGLGKSDFRVLEDGVEQQVEEFATTEEPFNIVLMIDSSDSTRFNLEDIQNAAIAFVEQLRPQDSVMVVSFDNRVWVDSEFTNDRERVRAAIRKTRTGVATRLYDALYLVLTERLRDVSGRKAIVLFSDGLDQGSRISDPDGALEKAERQNTFIYTVQYESSLPTSGFRAKADRNHARLFMKEVASRTGGGYYEAAGIDEISRAFSQVAGELRQQYLLGYYPANSRRDGRYRQIKVVVGRPEVNVRAREGYQAAGVRRDK
ncbi:MAG: VWA domain-containing protein [Blastocatellales bacterium]